eukprot:TRINITY_DN10651_c0_g1_i1.p1 TRINITY_DN10651_c0_g1~~TRINITY_DN10651_c0_g1_i1.p1  ORF type:complete len:395 (-),score=87.25 TRINITY_DN10651_c0_g1_i1:53-1237(-)
MQDKNFNVEEYVNSYGSSPVYQTKDFKRLAELQRNRELLEYEVNTLLSWTKQKQQWIREIDQQIESVDVAGEDSTDEIQSQEGVEEDVKEDNHEEQVQENQSEDLESPNAAEQGDGETQEGEEPIRFSVDDGAAVAVTRTSYVGVVIDEYSALFSSFDPRPYKFRNMSSDFLAELNTFMKRRSALLFLLHELFFWVPKVKKHAPVLNIILPKSKRNEDVEVTVKNRIESHLKHLTRKWLRRSLFTFVWAIILSLAGAGFLAFLSWIHFNHDDEERYYVGISTLDNIAWFLQWEGIWRLTVVVYEQVSMCWFLRRVSKLKVKFRGYVEEDEIEYPDDKDLEEEEIDPFEGRETGSIFHNYFPRRITRTTSDPTILGRCQRVRLGRMSFGPSSLQI